MACCLLSDPDKGDSMKQVSSVLLLLFAFTYAQISSADIFDRINECERIGGGACLYDLMRELAQQCESAHPGVVLRSGTYTSDNWKMTVAVSGFKVTIYDPVTTSQAGEYTCTGGTCVGPQFSFIVNGPNQLTMSYGRTWNRSGN